MRTNEKITGRFYHAYTKRLVSFLVPQGMRVFVVTDSHEGLAKAEGSFDYIVASDILGHLRDVQLFLEDIGRHLEADGRVVLTQYSALWEPVLRFASLIGTRRPSTEQNWLSLHDLKNLLQLAGFDVVKSGKKMLLPVYIPLLSAFCNTILANLWPFSILGLIHYVVARRIVPEKSGNPSVSIIIPARNEAGTIARIIHEIPTLGAFTELIFIEGHSTDDTLAVIKKEVEGYRGGKKLSYAVQGGKGKGDAVRKGFATASGDILMIYDADMTVPPEDLEKFYRAITLGRGDFVNGSRLVYPVEKGAMRLLNMAANKFFSLAFSTMLGQPIKDTLCGTKVLRKKDYEAIAENRSYFGDFDPFGDFDLIFGAAKLNLKIIDLPIHYRERVYGSTNISRFRHGWLLLKMTLFAARKLRFW